MAKEHIGLIHVSPNQSLIDEYEKDILQYLSVWEDKFWYDDFYPAWKDDRIGGTRETLVARRETMKEILQGNQFEQFKQMRLKEIDALLNTKDSNEDQEKLTRERTLLSTSSDFVSFGEKMGEFHEYSITADFEKYKRSLDFMTDNEDNRKQVNWTLDHLSPLVRERYAFMQGISFGVGSESANIKPMQSKVSHYYNIIEEGLKYYRDNSEKSWYVREHGREDHRDRISFPYIRKYAFQAKGVAQAYEDALTAITTSPFYEDMRRYYIDKAIRENDIDAKVAWENGSPDYILNDAIRRGLVAKPSSFSGLHISADEENVSRIVIPNLERLEKAENYYNYMVSRVNEFNQARQKDSSLLDKLRDVETQKLPVRLNLSNDNSASSRATIMGLADLMVQREAVSQGIYQGTKEALIIVASAATAGVAGVALGGASTLIAGMYTAQGVTAGILSGLALTGADIGADMYGPTASWKKDMQHWFDDTWVNRAFSGIKNSHVQEQITITIRDQLKQRAKAEQRIDKTDMVEFDKAIAFGVANSEAPEYDIFRFVQEARQIAQLPEKERNEYRESVRKATIKIYEEMTKNPDNQALQAEVAELARENLLLQAIRTGKYFYYAKQAYEVNLSALSGETIEEHIALYNSAEAEMLTELAKISQECLSAEMEAENRELTLNAWKNAGRPEPSKGAEIDASEAGGQDIIPDSVLATFNPQESDQEMQDTESNIPTTQSDSQSNMPISSDKLTTDSSYYEGDESMDEVLLHFNIGDSNSKEEESEEDQTDLTGITLSYHAQRYDESRADETNFSSNKTNLQHS